MKITSSEAAKLLRKLNEELASLQLKESQSKEFLAAVGENPEDNRPEYCFSERQAEIDILETKIRTLKHAINRFNVTQQVDGFDMTIDQMLVYIPQLNRKRDKLYGMKNRLPKARENANTFGKSSNIIDYRYINYDLEEVAKEYEVVADKLAQAQTALDLVNSTATMEVDI